MTLELDPQPGERLRRTIELEPLSLRLSGRLVAPAELGGGGVEGVTVGVWAHDADGERQLFLDESDAEGSFTVSAPPSAERYEVYPLLRGHDPYVSAPARSEVPGGGGDADGLAFVLHPKRILTGRVVDVAGHAVTGYDLSLLESGEQVPNVVREIDLGGGRFRLPLTPDLERLYVTAPGFRPASFELRGPHAPSGGEPLEVVLRRPPDLEGRVLDPDGRPLAGAVVALSTLEGLSFPIGSVHTPAARTGPDGSFVLHGVPHVPGARLLVAPEREQLPPLVHLRLEETGPTAELRVPRPVEVELRGRGQGALTIDAEGWPLNPEIEPALAALRAEDAPAFGDLIDGAARLWLAPGSYHFLSSVDGERHDVTGPVEVAGPGPVRVALP